MGSVAGLIVGAIPALFTLGLSLPVGLLVGGTAGLCTGVAAGSIVGFVGGGASGGAIAYYRVELHLFAKGIAARIDYVYDRVVRQPTLKVKSVIQCICRKTRESAAYAKDCIAALVSSRHAQVTTGSAAVGATALGTAGAAGGALAGAVAGAAVGLVPALFTFGLSIPVFAVIGGGMGMCIGTAAGAATGLTSGAAVGYAGYACRDKPAQAITFVHGKWQGSRGTQLQRKASSGGTEDDLSE